MTICKKCGIEKPVSDFSKSGKRFLADGTIKQYYKTICKKCVNVGPRPRTDNIDPKPCSSCGKVKPLTEYSFESNRYRAQCKACKYKQRLKFRSEHPEIYEKERERDRWRRANEPGYRERKNEDTMRSYTKHRDRRLQEYREKWINDDEYRENILQKRKDRWANDPEWKEKRKAENLKYRIENKEDLKVKSKIYYVNNKEKISEYGKKFRKDNPDHCRELAAKHYQNHKDKLVQDQRDLRSERKKMIFERIGWVCAHPGCTETKNLQIDHRDPLKKSFTITANLTKNWDELLPEVDKCQPLCLKHHMEKTAKEWENGTLQLSRKLNIKKGKR
tara:strand:+ start:47 stop:1042 length:996 start_codon:yes stop_codon:yes gene_type:complete